MSVDQAGNIHSARFDCLDTEQNQPAAVSLIFAEAFGVLEV